VTTRGVVNILGIQANTFILLYQIFEGYIELYKIILVVFAKENGDTVRR